MPWTTTDSRRRGVRRPLLVGTGLTAVAVVLLIIAFAPRPEPVTFAFDRSEFVELWNREALAADVPQLVIEQLEWTDEPAGVFGFAFTETMSVLGRVEGTPLREVDELALVGQPSVDGDDVVVAGMSLVIAVTEGQLDTEQRAEILTELALLGTIPADPDHRVTGGSTIYRAAADAAGEIIGIGAQPAGASD